MFEKKMNGRYITPFLSIVILLLLIGCEDFEDETYKMNLTDEATVEVFQDTNIVAIDAATILYDSTLSQYIMKHLGNKDTVSFAQILDTLDSDTIMIEPGESHYEISIAKTKTNAILLKSGAAGKVIIYSDDYIRLEIVDNANAPIEADDSSISPDLRAAFFEYDDQNDEITFNVKCRHSFNLSAENYLLKIYSTEQTDNRTFNFVVINEQ